jgi:predicted nucleic acid-binding protein
MQHAVRGTVAWAWDNLLLAEYHDVLCRPKFKLSPTTVKRLLTAFPEHHYRRGVSLAVTLPDPDDHPFLAVALATPDKVLVTGNPTHFPPAPLKRSGVRLYNPREALVELDRLSAKSLSG